MLIAAIPQCGFGFPDKRCAPPVGSLPVTATELGYWECDVDGSWAPYAWPTCSILEQAFCQHWAAAEFVERGAPYRVEFEGHLPDEAQAAVQVNTRTSARRKVRRWPSLWHRSCVLKRQQEQEQAVWAAWTEADFAWSLLDPNEFTAASTGSLKPKCATPNRRGYSLGAGCTFADGCWPSLLRTWPATSLSAAEHPLGSRCSFALQSLSGFTAGSERELEWTLLQATWRAGGVPSELVGAYRIQNRGLMHTFAALRQAMLARLACEEDFCDGASHEGNLKVQLLWHGTRSISGLLDICSDGFDRAHAQTCMYGKGCYFASSATYSDRYACSVKIPGFPQRNLRAMLLGAVLVGETVKGSQNMYPPPVKPHSRNGERYENACDNVEKPAVFVTFKDGQALPIYVMVYELKS